MTNRFSNLIGSAKYKLAQNSNTNTLLDMEQKSKPLTEYNIIDIVNQYQIFLDEREASKKYRINGRFNIYTSNVLSSGSTIYTNKFLDTCWSPMFYGYPSNISAPSNWLMQITYPSSSISNYDIESITDFGQQSLITKVYRGLQFQGLGTTLINNDTYLTVKGVQKHNLSVDEYVYICSSRTGNLVNSLQGVYRVKNLGINGQNLQKDLTLDAIVNPNDVPPYNSLGRFGNFFRVYEPSEGDTNFTNSINIVEVKSTDISGNTTTYTTNENRYAKIKTAVPHNLIKNNFVEINMKVALQTPNGVWRVYNVVSPTEFIIRVDVFPTSQSTTVDSYIGISFPTNQQPQCRLFDGIPSEYYVRQFEVLTTNDYSVYPCAFSSSIYPDVSDNTIGLANDTWLFQFNQDIDVARLKTDRNGPASDLYYTIIKRAGKNPTWPNSDSWTNVTAHWDFNFSYANINNGLELISNYNSNGIGSIEKLSGRTEYVDANGVIQAIPGNKYIGEMTEFNSGDLTEKTCAEIIHRFGIASRPINSEGYYYKPFKQLKIREYSTSIETAESDEFVIDIPSNYVTYANNSIAWRDLLSIGYFEENQNGVEYPFLNGKHYYYFNYNLYIRRQKPIITLSSNTFVTISTIIDEC